MKRNKFGFTTIWIQSITLKTVYFYIFKIQSTIFLDNPSAVTAGQNSMIFVLRVLGLVLLMIHQQSSKKMTFNLWLPNEPVLKVQHDFFRQSTSGYYWTDFNNFCFELKLLVCRYAINTSFIEVKYFKATKH